MGTSSLATDRACALWRSSTADEEGFSGDVALFAIKEAESLKMVVGLEEDIVERYSVPGTS